MICIVQSVLLLDTFNKDKVSIAQPFQQLPSLASLPVVTPPDARTQEMINEKLKKAEDLGKICLIFIFEYKSNHSFMTKFFKVVFLLIITCFFA